MPYQIRYVAEDATTWIVMHKFTSLREAAEEAARTVGADNTVNRNTENVDVVVTQIIIETV